MQIKKPSELNKEERSKIVDFFDSHPIGVLATVDTDGNPHASTIYFSIDSDMNITFTTKRDTHKRENIAHNSSVMLVAYDSESQTAAQAKGSAVEVTDLVKAQNIYHGTLRGAKQTSEDNVPPIAKIAAGPYVAYTIKPDNIWISEYGWGDNFANTMEQAGAPNEKLSTQDPA